VHVDRVEWLYIPEPGTAMAAFTAGEADWWENPSPDFFPLLERDPNVTLVQPSPFGNGGVVRFNHLLPPFDDKKMRQALLYAVDQPEYMRAVAGEAKYWHTCFSVYPCGSPMASDAGAEALKGPRDLAKAKQLIEEAGYYGERVVLLDPADSAQVHALALVSNEVLRRLGIKAEMQAMDTGTFFVRRALKEPIDKGGWNIFVTAFPGFLILDPGIHVGLRGNGAGWPGWPTDPVIETLRDQWIDAGDQAERKRIAAEIQRQAFTNVPYVPTGEWSSRTAFHNNLSGVNLGPVLTMWNVVKN
jgi:peptide/nickel transport system substrate-binding protein